MRSIVIRVVGNLTLLALLLTGDSFLNWSRRPSWMLYDGLASLHQRWGQPPPAIRDIVLVGIDPETLQQVPERWPYSRATFAKVMANLRHANARAIGLDFIFFGASTPQEDAALCDALAGGNLITLGATLTETGGIEYSTLCGPRLRPRAGLVNKLQDSDGVTRSALTYLVQANPAYPRARSFCWEMKLLEASRHVDLASLSDEGRTLRLTGPDGERAIPVEPVTKAFLIHFRAHSGTFQRLSFSQVLTGHFDPRLIEDKIVLIGLLSEVLQDLHRTPIGWLPGITLNANAFLTLYAKDFLKSIPQTLEYLVIALGVCLMTIRGFRHPFLWAGALILAFLAASELLLVAGYTWNYARFPASVIFLAGLSRWLTKRRAET